ncbi:MAG: hypothetical protein ACK55Z_17300, partial [bacterium]
MKSKGLSGAVEAQVHALAVAPSCSSWARSAAKAGLAPQFVIPVVVVVDAASLFTRSGVGGARVEGGAGGGGGGGETNYVDGAVLLQVVSVSDDDALGTMGL